MSVSNKKRAAFRACCVIKILLLTDNRFDPDGSFNEKLAVVFLLVLTYLLTYLLPYLLTPWSRVLLEKLTGFQLVKKFSAFCGTRKFVTVGVFVSTYLLTYLLTSLLTSSMEQSPS